MFKPNVTVESIIYYRLQQNCGKVMFLHLSVSHSVQGGLCPSMHHRSHDQGVSVKGGICEGEPPRQRPHSLYGKQREVRILLECILVSMQGAARSANTWQPIFTHQIIPVSVEEGWILNPTDVTACLPLASDGFTAG